MAMRPLVEGLVGQTGLFLLAVAPQEAEDVFFAHRGGAMPQQVNQAMAQGVALGRVVCLALHYGSLIEAETGRKSNTTAITSLRQSIHNLLLS